MVPSSINFPQRNLSGHISSKMNYFFSFFSEHHVFFQQGVFSTSAVVGYQLNWSKGWEHFSAVNPSGWML
jgi:hypothetical protein